MVGPRTLALDAAHPANVAAESFAAFYSASFTPVFDAVFAYCGSRDVAGDATQEAFSRAFSRWRRLSSEPWALGWVITTAINHSKRRERERRLKERLRSSTARRPDPPSSVDRIDIVRALRSLPERRRQATILFYLGDLPIAAVADLMGISEGAVKAHLAHARRSLRPFLEVTES